MAKRRGTPQNSPANVSPKRGVDPLGLATLVGVVAVLMISFWNWREITQMQGTLDDRLSEIEDQITQVSNRPAPRQQARRGPDPNRVYQIRTDGAPARGPSNAPVTVAVLSDFQ